MKKVHLPFCVGEMERLGLQECKQWTVSRVLTNRKYVIMTLSNFLYLINVIQFSFALLTFPGAERGGEDSIWSPDGG